MYWTVSCGNVEVERYDKGCPGHDKHGYHKQTGE